MTNEERLSKKLTCDQRQIILGSLLGNGFIKRTDKNYYFVMKHSLKRFDWVRLKSLELNNFYSDFFKNKSSVVWRSICHPCFNEIHSSCYEGDKKVTMDWLNSLRDIAIAVWYGDSGIRVGRGKKNSCLRTQSFGLKGNKIICDFFNEVGIFCNVNKNKRGEVIVFTVEGSRILAEKILFYWLPKFMWDIIAY